MTDALDTDTPKLGRPSKYDPSYCDGVEEHMATGLSLAAYAGVIGVARSVLTEWAKVYPEFDEAVDCAKSRRLLHWERAALKVAESGGGPGTATVITFGLRNMGGDEWADVHKSELTGKGGGPLQSEVAVRPDLAGLSPEDLRDLERILSKSSADSSAG